MLSIAQYKIIIGGVLITVLSFTVGIWSEGKNWFLTPTKMIETFCSSFSLFFEKKNLCFFFNPNPFNLSADQNENPAANIDTVAGHVDRTQG